MTVLYNIILKPYVLSIYDNFHVSFNTKETNKLPQLPKINVKIYIHCGTGKHCGSWQQLVGPSRYGFMVRNVNYKRENPSTASPWQRLLLSVQRWIMCVRPGGLPHAATSGSCKCYNPNAPWYVGNRQIHEDLWIPLFRRPHQRTAWEFRLKVGWCGEPLSSGTWKTLVPTKGWLKSPTGNRGGLILSRRCP
jgi:hypothetical protein